MNARPILGLMLVAAMGLTLTAVPLASAHVCDVPDGSGGCICPLPIDCQYHDHTNLLQHCQGEICSPPPPPGAERVNPVEALEQVVLAVLTALAS